MKRYSLADYILSVEIPEDLGFGVTSVSIGGEGSYLDKISIEGGNEIFKTTGDSTGSWVHTKNLDMTGSVEVSISQMSDKVALLKSLLTVYKSASSSIDGMTLTLRDNDNNTIAICYDCLLTGYPSQDFGESPGSQSWSFTCGKVTFL